MNEYVGQIIFHHFGQPQSRLSSNTIDVQQRWEMWVFGPNFFPSSVGDVSNQGLFSVRRLHGGWVRADALGIGRHSWNTQSQRDGWRKIQQNCVNWGILGSEQRLLRSDLSMVPQFWDNRYKTWKRVKLEKRKIESLKQRNTPEI